MRRMGGREEGERVTRRLMHSVPVGFGSGGGLFLLWVDGLLEALVWFVCLAGLAGLVWLYSRLGEELLLVLFCLFVRSIRTVCCMLYTVLVLSCLCALLILI